MYGVNKQRTVDHYNLQSPNISKVFGALPDSVAFSLVIRKLWPPTSAMVKLYGMGQVVKSKTDADTQVSLLMERRYAAFAARRSQFRDSGSINIVFHTRGVLYQWRSRSLTRCSVC